jgi:putative ABC transport system permease protein
MIALRLAIASLKSRKTSSVLTIVSIAFSVALLLTVETIRKNARTSFANTISQTDLVVGARTGEIQLLLYSIFHMGSATNNLSVKSYEYFKDHPAVDWTIPISLGDSHKGFRVVATNSDLLKHYRYRSNQSLEVRKGRWFEKTTEVVLGYEVAQRLGYNLAQKIILSHGIADQTILKHDNLPFEVTGVLAKTSTALDKSLFVSLEAMQAIHLGWEDGTPTDDHLPKSQRDLSLSNLKPDEITSFLLRCKSRIDSLRLQREINNFADEPLLAVIPGVVLNQLWDGLSYAESALTMVAALVVLVGLLGMLISIFNSLNERRREMAIYRTIGGSPRLIFGLLVMESTLLSFSGAVLGVFLCLAMTSGLGAWLEEVFGLYVGSSHFGYLHWLYFGGTILAGGAMGFFPAVRAYRNALVDGLALRV